MMPDYLNIAFMLFALLLLACKLRNGKVGKNLIIDTDTINDSDLKKLARSINECDTI